MSELIVDLCLPPTDEQAAAAIRVVLGHLGVDDALAGLDMLGILP